MQKQFVLQLNLNDWGILEEVAKKRGFNNSREMILHDFLELSKHDKYKKSCTEFNGYNKKHKHNFPIATEAHDFYQNLACSHTTSVSEIVYRYLVLPRILLHQLEKSEDTGLG